MGRSRSGHQGDVRVSADRDPEGQPRTLDAIYRDHADFVWRVVLRLGVPEAQAEDAVHELFIVVRKKLPEFRHEASERTWLFAIARGVCANLRRASERARRRLSVVEPPVAAEDPDEAVARKDAASLIDRFLDGLPAAQREVFAMIEVEEMSGPEVARALEVPLGSVYSRLRLARRRFEAFVDERADSRARRHVR